MLWFKKMAKILAFLLKLVFATISSEQWFLRKTPIFPPKIGKNRRKL
jgi:hypothetical protein